MKRIFRPLIDSFHNIYEHNKLCNNPCLTLTLNIIIDKAPRSRTKKQRRYEHVDLTKEFEIRHKKREQEKQAKLEELYEKHDKRALEFKGIIATGKQSTPLGGIESEEKAGALAK